MKIEENLFNTGMRGVLCISRFPKPRHSDHICALLLIEVSLQSPSWPYSQLNVQKFKERTDFGLYSCDF